MILISDRPGSLGNRLFVYAHFIAFSAEHGVSIWDPAFGDYASEFEKTASDPLCRYPPVRSRLPASRWVRSFLFLLARTAAAIIARVGPRERLGLDLLRIATWDLCDLSNDSFLNRAHERKVLLVQGWLFVDEKSLHKHADKVRRHLTPAAHHRHKSARTLAALRKTADVIVGLHIRQGDYAEFLQGRYFFSTEQYAAIAQRMTDTLEGASAIFVICSNSQQDPAAFDRIPCHFSSGTPIEDMCLLSGCDYIIGPPSTFTLWASFFGQVPLRMVQDPRTPFGLDDFEVASSQLDFPEVERLVPRATDETSAYLPQKTYR